jgi:hypothetical protein
VLKCKLIRCNAEKKIQKLQKENLVMVKEKEVLETKIRSLESLKVAASEAEARAKKSSEHAHKFENKLLKKDIELNEVSSLGSGQNKGKFTEDFRVAKAFREFERGTQDQGNGKLSRWCFSRTTESP